MPAAADLAARGWGGNLRPFGDYPAPLLRLVEDSLLIERGVLGSFRSIEAWWLFQKDFECEGRGRPLGRNGEAAS